MEHILNLLHVWAERKIIRDNFVGVHVKDWRKIALSPGERKLRHIRCPLLQRFVCAEVPVDDINGNLAYFATIRVVFLLGTFSGQPQPIHNTLNPLVIHRETTLYKFLTYSSYAVPSFYALGYASNDLVLIVLWILASLESPEYIPVAVNFAIFFLNDMYGFIRWKKREGPMHDSDKRGCRISKYFQGGSPAL